MSAHVFDQQDEPFLNWMAENPDGYVVNTERRQRSRLFFLHQSNCFHISGYVSGQEPNAFTARDYIKVCSNDANDLLAWAAKHRPHTSGFSDLCQTCQPNPEILPVVYPDQVQEQPTFPEGATRTVQVNYYERSSAARRKCIEHWGLACSVCEMRFDKRYGEIGEGFIHVHHLRELSKIGKAYRVDPIEDLRPVCPNCHAMLHKNDPTLPIDELKRRLRR